MFLSQKKFCLFLLSAFLCSAILANAQTPPVEDDDIEKVVTEEVKLNISAFDASGKFVPDVKKQDLVIMEDNRLHQANSLRRIPANVLIVLDTGGEMRRAKSIDQTRATAVNLVNALQKEDSVAVLQYHDKVEIIAEWTTDKNEILNILKGKMNFGKRSFFLSAMETATDFLQKTPLENRHLVLITDGTDTLNDKDQRKKVLDDLISTNISVHVISYTQLEQKELAPSKGPFRKGDPNPKRAPEEVINTMPNGVKELMKAPRLGSVVTDREFLRNIKKRDNALVEGEEFLTTLAKDTNGQLILPETKDEMLRKPQLIARLIDSSYVVTYTPKRPFKDAPKGEVRQVIVTSKRSGLEVQAYRKITLTQKDAEEK